MHSTPDFLFDLDADRWPALSTGLLRTTGLLLLAALSALVYFFS